LKFPDFNKCIEINQLMVAMGVINIPSLPTITFEREVVRKIEHSYIDPAEINIDATLKRSAIPVNKSDFTGLPGELLEYKGRKVCAYIRDQKAKVDFYHNTSGYRYHLCNCGTIQKMRNIGRGHRFLTTQRADGTFEAHDLTTQPPETGLVKMELCQQCIQILRQKGIFSTPFSLKEYFLKYDSYTPKTLKRIEEVRKTQTYSPNWKEISLKYRSASKYICQICDVDCKRTQNLLHVHHEDGNPANNTSKNLKVLCVDCHTKQPLHGHMLSNSQFVSQINIIRQLRTDQGLLTVR